MSSIKTELEKGEWMLVSDKPAFIRQNLGNSQVVYLVANSLPAGFDQDTATMKTTIKGGSTLIDEVDAGSAIYAYSISADVSLSVTWFDSAASFLANMVTDLGSETSRFKVDSQPTSFENNSQFHIFYQINELAFADQLVMKFDSINAINIMARKINLWEGGRTYLIYNNDGTHTTVPTVFAPLKIYPVNSNVQGGGSHPVSELSIGVAIGSGIFVNGSEAFNGNAVLTDSNNNRASNQALTIDNLAGYKAGTSLYLVMDSIGFNSDTNGHFYLQWEERF